VVVARSRFRSEHPEVKIEDLVIYTTTQTHSIGLKAGLVLGISVRALDVTPTDQFSLRGKTLRAALEEDEKNGRKPFILSKSACPHHNLDIFRNLL
jgi:aromatic-L-amino-acid decarboxylase